MKFTDSTTKGWFLIGSFLFASVSSHGEICKHSDAGDAAQQASKFIDSQYYPEDLIGSCAVVDHKSRNGWRLTTESKVSSFLSQDRTAFVHKILKDQSFDLNRGAINMETFKEYGNQYRAYEAAKAKFQDPKESAFKSNNKLDMENAWREVLKLTKKMDAQRAEWLQNYEKDLLSQLSNDDIKRALIEKTNSKYCSNGVNYSFVADPGMNVALFKKNGSEENARKVLDDQIKSILSNNTNKDGDGFVHVCTKPVHRRSSLLSVSTTASFDLDAQSTFISNKAIMSQASINNIKNKLKKLLTSSGKDCVKKIKSIQVQTSSNPVKNDPPNKPWGFMDLSSDRSEYLKQQVGAFFEEHKSDKDFKLAGKFDDIVDVDPTGSNGDGTSGTCPYHVVPQKDGKFLIERNPAVSKAEMTSSRFGRVMVEVSEEGPGCSVAAGQKTAEDEEYVASKCFTVQINCI